MGLFPALPLRYLLLLNIVMALAATTAAAGVGAGIIEITAQQRSELIAHVNSLAMKGNYQAALTFLREVT